MTISWYRYITFAIQNLFKMAERAPQQYEFDPEPLQSFAELDERDQRKAAGFMQMISKAERDLVYEQLVAAFPSEAEKIARQIALNKSAEDYPQIKAWIDAQWDFSAEQISRIRQNKSVINQLINRLPNIPPTFLMKAMKAQEEILRTMRADLNLWTQKHFPTANKYHCPHYVQEDNSTADAPIKYIADVDVVCDATEELEGLICNCEIEPHEDIAVLTNEEREELRLEQECEEEARFQTHDH